MSSPRVIPGSGTGTGSGGGSSKSGGGGGELPRASNGDGEPSPGRVGGRPHLHRLGRRDGPAQSAVAGAQPAVQGPVPTGVVRASAWVTRDNTPGEARA
jgi:hypothetical protein